MDLRNFKATIIPFPLIVFLAALSMVIALSYLTRNLTHGVPIGGTKYSMERAYFEGQRDALNGDVRIKYNESTKKYFWSKSCWDDGTKPDFNP